MTIKEEYHRVELEEFEEMTRVKSNMVNGRSDYLKKCLEVSMKTREYDSVKVEVDIDRNGKYKLSDTLTGIKLSTIDNKSLWALHDAAESCKLVEVTVSVYLSDGSYDEDVTASIKEITPENAMLIYDLAECTQNLYNAIKKNVSEMLLDLHITKEKNLLGVN